MLTGVEAMPDAALLLPFDTDDVHAPMDVAAYAGVAVAVG